MDYFKLHSKLRVPRSRQQRFVQKSLYSEQNEILLASLREARKAAGISQTDLGAKLDMTQSVIGKCERGERRLDLVELRQWVLAIGLPVVEFVAHWEMAIQQAAAVKAATEKAKAARKAIDRQKRAPVRKTLRKNRAKKAE